MLRPSADTRGIVAAAVGGLRHMFRVGFLYAKAGVMLADLRPANQQQGMLDLFASGPDTAVQGTESPRLKHAVDRLNRSFGQGAVLVASAQHQRRHRQHAGRRSR